MKDDTTRSTAGHRYAAAHAAHHGSRDLLEALDAWIPTVSRPR